FSRVVSQTLGILRVAPREQRVPATVLAEAPPPAAPVYAPGVVPAARRAERDAAPVSDGEERTPSTLGMTARQALAGFARFGVLPRFRGPGFVVPQHPPAGSPIRPGSVHTLFLADSAGTPARAGGRRAEETAPPPTAP